MLFLKVNGTELTVSAPEIIEQLSGWPLDGWPKLSSRRGCDRAASRNPALSEVSGYGAGSPAAAATPQPYRAACH